MLKYLAGTDAQIYLRALVVFALLHRCKKKRGQDGTASSDLVQDWKIVSVNLEITSLIKSLGHECFVMYGIVESTGWRIVLSECTYRHLPRLKFHKDWLHFISSTLY